MLEIKPVLYLDAEVTIPASKSYSNRFLLISALAGGISALDNISNCDDTRYMIKGLRELGVYIKRSGSMAVVEGTSGVFPKRDPSLELGNAGTAVRFLTALSCLTGNRVLISGDERMNQRPIGDLIDALSAAGAKIYSIYKNRCTPVVIEAGRLKGGEIEIDCSKSSQYLSSLLMCSPYAKDDVTIKVISGIVSRPYIDMTIKAMECFGITVEHNDYKRFLVKANRVYNAADISIEADASGASYFFAAAAISKGRVRVNKLNKDTLQGDIKFVSILERMGCTVNYGEDFVEVIGGKLRGVDVDMNHMPDVVQTLSITALFAVGETVIRNVGNLTIKETDRLYALKKELTKVGAMVKDIPDGISIYPGDIVRPAVIETYNDHRMAMSFSVLGLKAKGISIKDETCVSKSFPDFYKLLQKLY